MNVIIPLAGVGERFRREGYRDPKPCISVLDKPILFYVLDGLRLQPDDKVFILYNANLQDHFFCDMVSSKYPTFHLIEMPSTRGAAETLRLGIQRILESGLTNHKQCVIMDGDTYYTEDILSIIRGNSNGNLVFYTHNTEKYPLYSYIQINDSGIITAIREKEKISDNANTGVYCFANIHELHHFCKHIVDKNIRFRNEFYTSCAISEMIQTGHTFQGVRLDESTVISLGTPRQVQNYIQRTHGFLFDLDGTLVQTDVIYYDVWMRLLEQHSITLTHDIFEKYIRGQSDASVQRTLLSHSLTPLHELSARKDALFIEHIGLLTEVTGAVAFVRKVRSLGHKIAIVTNCNRRVAEVILQHIRLMDFVDRIIIGDECERSKPYPDPYIAAMTSFGLSPDKCFVFEDSKTGILSGIGIQPKCIVGIQTCYSAHELRESGANIAFTDFCNIEIQDLLNYSSNALDTLTDRVIQTLHREHKSVQTISWTSQKLKGGYISDVLAFDAHASSESISCVLKLENQNDSHLSKMANTLGLYEREYYFYECISKYIPIGIPRFYGLVKTPKFKNIGLVLENLTTSCDLALDLNKESVDISMKVIDACAQLHASFWNVDLLNSFPLLKKHNDPLFNPIWSDYIQKQWPLFCEKWKFMIADFQMGKLNEIAHSFQKIQHNLSSGCLTLVHGDVKTGNIFYRKPDRKPYFLDWQYIAIGKGVQDIVFLMIESFDIQTIRGYFTLFKQYYYIKLLEYGVKTYSREEYEQDFKDAVHYFPFFVAVWFGTTSSDDLIDKNFPFFFLQKYLHFLDYMDSCC